MQLSNTIKTDGILFYLLILTGFFLLLEISFFIQSNSAYLSDFAFVSEHLTIPSKMYPGILLFIGTQLGLHLSYCLITWCLAVPISNLFSLHGKQRLQLAIIIWSLGIITILIANQCYFPNSKFSELTALIFMNATVARYLLIFFSSLYAIAIVFMLFEIIRHIAKPILLAFILTVGVTWIFFSNQPPITPYDAATKEKPNIILVGVDSLRPDFVRFFGATQATPFMDSFLDQAVVFSEAVTPLARTFPSWVSILTGEYPLHVPARTNLAQQEKMNLTQSLPAILRKHGYETFYASDETRFSNIDKNFGFDHVVTPPMGLNDFLIGTFNDFPMSNLLVNTIIGQWLFPYSFANRPVSITYHPDSFLKLMDPAIPLKRSKPLFLTVHFCLPHTPYFWSSLPSQGYTAQERYEQSIGRVDKQLFDFFVLLKKRGLLEHAIVVLLSDHGEALELSGDRLTEKELFFDKKMPAPIFYPPSLDKEAINQSAGHGTDVLGLTQYHTLLAFKLYGVTENAEHSVQAGVVSLIDIKPTLLQLIGLSNEPSMGSESLAPRILGQRRGVSVLRHIFLESDFSPESIRTVYPETRKVLLDGVQLFQINPSTLRLTVKDDMASMIIHSKQYADIYDDWMLALYPQNQHTRMPILINLISGQWTNDLRSPFAQQSPAAYMLQALKTFYGAEIDNI